MIKKKIKRVFLAGSGKDVPAPPVPVLLPPNSDGAKRSIQKLQITDLLCEGPIEGIVDQDGNTVSGLDLGKGIYLNSSPVINEDGEFNFNAFEAEYKNGSLSQAPFGGTFASQSKVVDINQRLIGVWNWTDSGESEFHQDESSIDKRILDENGGSGFREFGTWRGLIDTDGFPEDEVFGYTHTIDNPNATDAKINLSITSLFDTVSKGSGEGEGGDIGTQVSATIRFELSYGYFDSASAKVLVSSKTEEVSALISSSPYGMTIPVSFSNGFPSGLKKWISVKKLSFETLSPLVSREMALERVTYEINDPKFSLPTSVMVASKYDARVFSQLPQRTFDCKFKIIRVPSNYFPNSRNIGETLYSGVWDGTFKWSWSDNPAWILYDLLVNNTYGVGDFIDHSLVDKWTLYEIGRYCDSVDENGVFLGMSGVNEPRFSCNIYINESREAFSFINSIAAIFRGFTYWMNGGLLFSDDRPKDAIMTFSNTDVKDGAFNYAETAKNTRFTVAEVQFNDLDDDYSPKIESVEDADGLSKLGPIVKRVEGLGTVSRSAAQRLGKYILYTSKLDKETVSFTASQEVLMMLPGDVFGVSDKTKTIKRASGKILKVEKNEEYNFYTGLKLDAPIPSWAKYITIVYPQDSSDYRDVMSAFGSFENHEEQVEFIKNFRKTQQITVPFAKFFATPEDPEETGSLERAVPKKNSLSIHTIHLNKCGNKVVFDFDTPLKDLNAPNEDVDFQFISDLVFDATGTRMDYDGDFTWGITKEDKFLEDQIGYTFIDYGFESEDSLFSSPLSELDDYFRTGNYSYVLSSDDESNVTPYRLIGYREVNANEYEVVGLSYNQSKFDSIEGDYVDSADFSFGDIVSETYGIVAPQTPQLLQGAIYIQPSGGLFEKERAEDYTFDWSGDITAVSSFVLTSTSPSGVSFSKEIPASSYLSVASSTYSFGFSRVVEGETEDLDYGGYAISVYARAKSPYFTPSPSISTSANLSLDSSLIIDDFYSVSSLTLSSSTESSPYSYSGVNGEVTFDLSIRDLSLSWTLLSPIGSQINTSEGYFSEIFDPVQKIYLLDDLDQKIPTAVINPVGLSASITREFIEGFTTPETRSYSLLLEVSSSISNDIFQAKINVDNDKPSITLVTVEDANTVGVLGEVNLSVDIDPLASGDLEKVYVFYGDSHPVTPDLTSFSNLMIAKTINKNSTNAIVTLKPQDGQSTVIDGDDLPADYNFARRDATNEEILAGKTNPKGYTYYSILVTDAVGFSDPFANETKGIIRFDDPTGDEIGETNERIDEVIDELENRAIARDGDFIGDRIVISKAINEIEETDFSLADVYGYEGIDKQNIYKHGFECQTIPADINVSEIRKLAYSASEDKAYLYFKPSATTAGLQEKINTVYSSEDRDNDGVILKIETYDSLTTPVYYPNQASEITDGDLIITVATDQTLDFSIGLVGFGVCLFNISGTSVKKHSCITSVDLIVNKGASADNKSWKGSFSTAVDKPIGQEVVLDGDLYSVSPLDFTPSITVSEGVKYLNVHFGSARTTPEGVIAFYQTVTPQDWNEQSVNRSGF